MSHAETIVAAATPRGRGALAIIRISGPQAFQITARCLIEERTFDQAQPRSIHLYRFKDSQTGRLLDQVTLVKYATPRSFTGEDLVEIVCHGGPRIVEEITTALLARGCRGAARGEFTRRALENGKLDLLQAEAIGGMIDSESEAALECSRRLLSAGGHRFRTWKEELLEISAQLEAHIEFEEDVGSESIAGGREKIQGFYKALEADLRKREEIRFLEKGLRVVIAGPANAGKSSLFNLLVGFSRSIVHQEAGTTRDLVSETVSIGGHEVTLIDSAGLRESLQEVEITGIGLTRKAIIDSRAVIWVTSAEEKFTGGELQEMAGTQEKNLLVVVNKTDKAEPEEKLKALSDKGYDAIGVSVKAEINRDEMISIIRKKIVKLHEKIELPDLLFNERQAEVGKALKSEILGAIEQWERPEIAAHYLNRAIGCLDEFFGATNAEEVMNRVFGKFCIGK